VTTDKCYENREWAWGYRENEAMGGHDPYSSSKGCAELVSAAYRRSFFQQPDGTFLEAAEKDEPALDSPGQCVRIADIDRDGRPDLVLSKTVSAVRPEDVGGWDVYLNRR